MESIKIRKTLLKLDNFGRFFLKIYIHISLALKKVIILNIWKGKIVLQEKDYNVQFEKKTFFVPITGIFAHLSKCNDFSLIKLGRFKYVVWQYECVLCVFLGNGLFFITLMGFCKCIYPDTTQFLEVCHFLKFIEYQILNDIIVFQNLGLTRFFH